MTKRNPKQIFLAEISKHTGLHESDFSNITEYECLTPGKHKDMIVGETRTGKMFIAENGFLRQYNPKVNCRWDCKVLAKVPF